MIIGNFADLSQQPIVACPICASIDCQSNRISNPRFDEIIVIAWSTHRAGHSKQGLRTLLAWASVELANALRDDFQCSHCRRNFR